MFSSLNSPLQEACNLLSAQIRKNDEAASIVALDDFIKEHGTTSLDNIRIDLNSKNGVPHKFGLVAYASIFDQVRLLRKLLDYDLDPDIGVTSPSPTIDGCTPLMFACEYGRIEVATLLIDYDADILDVSTSGYSVLMKIESLQLFNIIITAAKKRNCLEWLISIKDESNNNAYQIACYFGRFDIAKELFSLKSYSQSELKSCLHFARRAAWDHAEKRQAFSGLCMSIRAMCDAERCLEFPKDAAKLSPKDASLVLYGEDLIGITPDCKVKAVKKAIAQFYSLLNSPERCLPYLKFLNDEFLKYFRSKHNKDFPIIDPSSYHFAVLDGTIYPIPTLSYTKIKKHSALQEFLILLFKQHNLAHQAYKWVGFVPPNVANKMMGDGDFVYESRLGLGLFHGKLAHMLQNAILIYAIQNNEINTIYSEGCDEKQITIKDILTGLVTIPRYQYNESLWNTVRDRRHFETIKFSDPNRMCSVIMNIGRQLGLDGLADYLTDSFCNGFVQLEHAFKAAHPDLNLTRENYIEQAKDLDSVSFEISSSLYQYVLTMEVNRAKQRFPDSELSFFKPDSYLAVPKTYSPDLGFAVSTYNT